MKKETILYIILAILVVFSVLTLIAYMGASKNTRAYERLACGYSLYSLKYQEMFYVADGQKLFNPNWEKELETQHKEEWGMDCSGNITLKDYYP